MTGSKYGKQPPFDSIYFRLYKAIVTQTVSIHRSHFQKSLYFRRFPLSASVPVTMNSLFFSHLTTPAIYSYFHYNKIKVTLLYYFIQKKMLDLCSRRPMPAPVFRMYHRQRNHCHKSSSASPDLRHKKRHIFPAFQPRCC